MKHSLIFILFFFLISITNAQSKKINRGILKVNNCSFYYSIIRNGYFYNKETHKTDSTDFETNLLLFRNGKKILTHIIRQNFVDCNSQTIELGDYEFSDSSIIFYSYWAWQGGCCSGLFGARIQEFKVLNNGQLKLSNSKIYLQKQKNDIENMSLTDRQKYISKIEKDYYANFITGDQADKLIQIVKNKLANQIQIETNGFERNERGYKK
jgi:hypothetical protein